MSLSSSVLAAWSAVVRSGRSNARVRASEQVLRAVLYDLSGRDVAPELPPVLASQLVHNLVDPDVSPYILAACALMCAHSHNALLLFSYVAAPSESEVAFDARVTLVGRVTALVQMADSFSRAVSNCFACPDRVSSLAQLNIATATAQHVGALAASLSQATATFPRSMILQNGVTSLTFGHCCGECGEDHCTASRKTAQEAALGRRTLPHVTPKPATDLIGSAADTTNSCSECSAQSEEDGGRSGEGPDGECAVVELGGITKAAAAALIACSDAMQSACVSFGIAKTRCDAFSEALRNPKTSLIDLKCDLDARCAVDVRDVVSIAQCFVVVACERATETEKLVAAVAPVSDLVRGGGRVRPSSPRARVSGVYQIRTPSGPSRRGAAEESGEDDVPGTRGVDGGCEGGDEWTSFSTDSSTSSATGSIVCEGWPLKAVPNPPTPSGGVGAGASLAAASRSRAAAAEESYFDGMKDLAAASVVALTTLSDIRDSAVEDTSIAALRRAVEGTPLRAGATAGTHTPDRRPVGGRSILTPSSTGAPRHARRAPRKGASEDSEFVGMVDGLVRERIAFISQHVHQTVRSVGNVSRVSHKRTLRGRQEVARALSLADALFGCGLAAFTTAVCCSAYEALSSLPPSATLSLPSHSGVRGNTSGATFNLPTATPTAHPAPTPRHVEFSLSSSARGRDTHCHARHSSIGASPPRATGGAGGGVPPAVPSAVEDADTVLHHTILMALQISSICEALLQAVTVSVSRFLGEVRADAKPAGKSTGTPLIPHPRDSIAPSEAASAPLHPTCSKLLGDAVRSIVAVVDADVAMIASTLALTPSALPLSARSSFAKLCLSITQSVYTTSLLQPVSLALHQICSTRPAVRAAVEALTHHHGSHAGASAGDAGRSSGLATHLGRTRAGTGALHPPRALSASPRRERRNRVTFTSVAAASVKEVADSVRGTGRTSGHSVGGWLDPCTPPRRPRSGVGAMSSSHVEDSAALLQLLQTIALCCADFASALPLRDIQRVAANGTISVPSVGDVVVETRLRGALVAALGQYCGAYGDAMKSAGVPNLAPWGQHGAPSPQSVDAPVASIPTSGMGSSRGAVQAGARSLGPPHRLGAEDGSPRGADVWDRWLGLGVPKDSVAASTRIPPHTPPSGAADHDAGSDGPKANTTLSLNLKRSLRMTSTQASGFFVGAGEDKDDDYTDLLRAPKSGREAAPTLATSLSATVRLQQQAILDSSADAVGVGPITCAIDGEGRGADALCAATPSCARALDPRVSLMSPPTEELWAGDVNSLHKTAALLGRTVDDCASAFVGKGADLGRAVSQLLDAMRNVLPPLPAGEGEGRNGQEERPSAQSSLSKLRALQSEASRIARTLHLRDTDVERIGLYV